MRKLFACALLLICFLLSACSEVNEYGLVYNSDGGTDIDYIYYDDVRVVYVVGGLMMVDIDGEAKMLEMALNEGDVTVDNILASAEENAADGDLKYTEYPDGSREYYYEGFTLVALNTHLSNRDVYFVPTGMGYYDVTNS